MSIRSGDQCPKCQRGRMRAITSQRIEEFQKQRLECNGCGHRENSIVRGNEIWRRKEIA